MGEADLVCLSPDRSTLVIVEVKARRIDGAAADHYPPEAAITIRKRRKLLHVAAATASRLNWGDRSLRIDVVAVEMPVAGKPSIRHHLSAVTS
jgi:Holliday junction resolvase-like predicted endonuclease